jgi:hypothetical protein
MNTARHTSLILVLLLSVSFGYGKAKRELLEKRTANTKTFDNGNGK